MPKYMIVHQKSPEFVSYHINLGCKICAREKRAIWKRVFYNLKEGRIFCVWEAPSRDILKEVLSEHKLPCAEVVEVEVMTPAECDWAIFGEMAD
ncbi:MAG: hypothetical protein AUJ48_02935 [Deltaproteobacteria bacterium CG1_02_45_11]|nr:MAG: hypothetical protein AUJ48_02935 [Deltaproteobacteria bacterium CG1_02_45_11]